MLLPYSKDLPSSLPKPIFESCCLYDGAHITNNQVPVIFIPTSSAKGGFATRLSDFVTSSTVHLRSPLENTLAFLKRFSQTVHHLFLTEKAEQSSLTTSPEQRCRSATRLNSRLSIFERTSWHKQINTDFFTPHLEPRNYLPQISQIIADFSSNRRSPCISNPAPRNSYHRFLWNHSTLIAVHRPQTTDYRRFIFKIGILL